MKQILQNINKVEFIETRRLHNIVLLSDHEVNLRYWRNFKEICIVGLADMEVADTEENGSRLTTVKLSFRIASDFQLDNRRLAWRVTTVTGEQYLIGIDEQPYPIVTFSDSFPDKPTSPGGKTITVTWQTPLNLLKIMG